MSQTEDEKEQYRKLAEKHRQHHLQQELAMQKYLSKIKTEYKHKYPDLLNIEKWEFEENFINAVKSKSIDQMKKILVEVSPQIYAFNMITPKFASLLVEELANFEKWSEQESLHVHRPNSMNNYGAILDHFGFFDVLQKLMTDILAPFSKFLYPHIHGPDGKYELDDHHGFVVEYQEGKDTKLDFHVDSSEVTLNLCLGKVFTGGLLYFAGVRCQSHVNMKPEEKEEFLFEHKIGQGILHLGKHRHAARPITSGHRLNLILWCKSSDFKDSLQGRGDSCPPWCGYHRSHPKVLSIESL